MTEKYKSYLKDIFTFIPKERVYVDELRRLAWGTDAGFYRLIPQIVIRSENEQEIARLLQLSKKHQLPVTFRAAGTSLSGQSISDSILIVAGKHWEKYHIDADGKVVTLQPGIIGQRVNELLAPYGRKFSPDPASVKSAMIGGIVANNASGMNCGTHANSDKKLLSARIVLSDGTILDTADAASKEAFKQTHPDFISAIERLRDQVRSNTVLAARIQKKYSIKNVVGLNIRPFVGYTDPFDIITHLMVGAEGTLGFLSEMTFSTEYDYPFKASAMIYFKDIREACRAVVTMKQLTAADVHPTLDQPLPAYDPTEPIVKGAELLDHKSLAAVEDTTGEGLTAILCETKASTHGELMARIAVIEQALSTAATFQPVRFTDKKEEYAKYWSIRSGVFPSVGGTRPIGTTCLIEDVAFPIAHLPEAAARLQALLLQHGYTDACIYGHALEGNFHFIINQSFDTDVEVKRYEDLMRDVVRLVVDDYDGSLKAEHGTGRNMAPFVRKEWGDEAYTLMKAVKELFDPEQLLNPGVIFNDDPTCHIKNFKPLPICNDGIDRCIECGFCEVNCVSCGFTLSSRQRNVVQREISRLKAIHPSGKEKIYLEHLQQQYRYLGNDTCAGDGLCSMSCPMGINVGHFTHELREADLPANGFSYRVGDYVAQHFQGTKNCIRPVLSVASLAQNVMGNKLLGAITQKMHSILGVPQWTPAMPKAYRFKEPKTVTTSSNPLKVVYFPSCINQMMGTSKGTKEQQPLAEKTIHLLQKAGYEVLFPKGMDSLCCGTIWESKGMPEVANRKSTELEKALYEVSEQGKYPVVCDQSPCLYRMRTVMTKVNLYEPVEFILKFLVDRLHFKPIDRHVTVHATCSMVKMGLSDELAQLARLCSTNVLVPEEVGCCAFAGDKGFTNPELNTYALRKLPPQIMDNQIEVGYSNSRTCEIGLTTNTKIPYMSIVYLVDECTTAKNKAE
ncbi:MAG: FAD-binding and (Fe-S)-binding domain-containing protein [Bacteroidaceae bacterium]|nr:FAD-binding and (Fe-S)-binding domain-containing protein [Bacteroidaceae bacterium]